MALATHTPTTWDAILSTTMHNYRKSLTDNIFGSRPLLEYLMSKGRVRTVDGGISIVEPLLLGPGEANSYGPWQQIQVNAVAGISAAQFPWRQLYATIIISGLEEAQNNGKEQAISLIEAKVMQAEETLKDLLSKMIYGTRGGAALATDFTPFTTLIDATAAAGGITPAAAPAPENNWRSPTWDAAANTGVDAEGVAITMPGAALTAPYDGKEIETALRHMFLLASDGGSDHVDAIFAGAGWYEAYEAQPHPAGPLHRHVEGEPRVPEPAVQERAAVLRPGLPVGHGARAQLEVHRADPPLGPQLRAVPVHVEPVRLGRFDRQPEPRRHRGRPRLPTPSTLGCSFITTYGNTTTRQRRRNFKITGATFA